MGFRDIKHNNMDLTVHKAITEPRFNEKTVLVTSTWDYVDLWLKRAGKHEARFFWNQAHSFYDATMLLPKTSAPLTGYYCFLNATKALLLTKGVAFSDEHGVSGYTIGTQTSLSNEKVKFKRGGILPALCQHLGEPSDEEIYSLKDLLYNMPIIHRAFDLTYSADPELFIPIKNPKIVRSDTTHEAWFCGELTDKYATRRTINKLSNLYEQDLSEEAKFIVRSTARFNWRPSDRTASLNRYKNYHKRLRTDLLYINGPSRLWYLKRSGNNDGIILRNTMALMFAAMHKLSEMARYTPDVLSKHFDCQHNWLLSEFITSAPTQFIDEISSELTGHEFMIPGRN
ncbi:YaaC family protein [Marinomonas balearica]|uniref:YaaC-like protein n=1 Tax=Marinomonas balearica TaxID=491947 RepID=A0A4R6MDW8_9GAMM|nr:YaaC family protein [Marinomonas balearica]TDO99744.1 YaaC-like protein [Marinomonas balearica]